METSTFFNLRSKTDPTFIVENVDSRIIESCSILKKAIDEKNKGGNNSGGSDEIIEVDMTPKLLLEIIEFYELFPFTIGKNSEWVKDFFKKMSSDNRSYVTCEELYGNFTLEQIEYCIERMNPYIEAGTDNTILGSLDYETFVKEIFQN